MKARMIQLSSIRPHPRNPRRIEPAEFEKLKKSLQQDPEILTVNPIVLDSKKDYTILAGQWRYTALLELGHTEIPLNWVLFGDTLTAEQKEKFLLLDNHHSGTWDISKLMADWDIKKITGDWNISIPDIKVEVEMPELLPITGEKQETPKPPTATDNDYSVFECVMLHENKVKLLDVLNRIKADHQLEKIEEALMYLAEQY